MTAIIHRNFFRLLRAGAFGQQETVEPMSAWKWQQVLALALQHGLAPLLHDGILAVSDQFFMHLTDAQRQQWQQATLAAEQQHAEACRQVAALLALLSERQLRPILLEPWTTTLLCPQPQHHVVGPVNIFFPYSTQGKKADDWAEANGQELSRPTRHTLRYQWQGLSVEHRHRMLQLSNRLNNLTLQHIIEREWLDGGTSHTLIGSQRVETLAPTLGMLIALLSMVKSTLSDGLSLWRVVDVGTLLRQQGHQVDFVKLQEWIDRLHQARMVNLAGQILTTLLGFTPDEVPFLQTTATAQPDALASSILERGARRPNRYLHYSPGESLSGLLASISHSLDNIQE